MKQYCGNNIPGPFISSGRTMTVKFHSDWHGSATGFLAVWSNVTEGTITTTTSTTTTTTPTTATTTWHDATSVGLGLLMFHKVWMKPEEAKQFCLEKDSHLVEIETEDQLEAFRDLLKNTIYEPSDWYLYLTGGTDEADEGVWIWPVSGTPVQNFIWIPGQPTGNYGNHLTIDTQHPTHPFAGTECGNCDVYPICQKLTGIPQTITGATLASVLI